MSIIAAARSALPHLSDYTDQEIMDVMAKIDGVKPGSQAYKRLESEAMGYDRTVGDAVKDTGVALLQNSLGLAKIGSTIGAAVLPGVSTYDNAATQWLGKASDAVGMVYKSQGLKNREAGSERAADIARRTAEAGGAGTIGQIGAEIAGKAGAYSPQQAAQDALTSAGTFVGPAAIGRGLQLGGAALGLGAKGAMRAGVAGGVGSAAAMQGADVGTDTYNRMVQAGADPETARVAANRAAVKGGLATIATSMLPGGSTIERSLLSGATMGRVGMNSVARRGLAGVAEAGTEAVEEGYGQYANNQEMNKFDGKSSLTAGVGSAAVQGAVAAGPMGAMASHGAHPRTATGEIDLTGTPVGPTPLDEPTWSRRGLDPLNERSSVIPNPAQQAKVLQGQQNGQGTIMVTPDGTALPAQSPEQMARLEEMRRFNDGIPTLTDVLAPADGIPVLNDKVAQPDIPTLTDQLAPPDGIPVLTDVVNNPGRPNRGQVLAALAKASTQLDKAALKKDGQLPNTRAAAPLRQVMESKDPLAAMRELHQDGTAPRDEMIDAWHKNLTGQTVFEWKDAQSPATNSAGFVAEPAAQVAAQLDAVREGRKDAAVLGEQEAAAANLDGLHSAVATGPEGDTAVVVASTPAKVKKAVARAKKVGLKQAMGEALGVANPTLTTETNPDAGVVQHVDDKTGQVIGEELATPADAANVTPIEGTTQRVVTPEQVVADRQVTTFKTAKGSTYTVNPDGTTTRDKAGRPEHPGEQGVQETSKRTVYVTAADAQKLGEIQTKGGARKGLAFDDKAGQMGVRYLDGKDQGKLERRTVVPFKTEPAVGLTPVEHWGDDKTVHFGNAIVDVGNSAAPKREKPAKAAKLGRKSVAALIETAETTADEQEYQNARYELYKRWAEGDASADPDAKVGPAEAYLHNKKNHSDMKKAEKDAFELRYQAELKERGVKKGQKLGAKFGAATNEDIKLANDGLSEDIGNPDNSINPMTADDVAGITDGKSGVQWLIDNAKDPWHRAVAKLLAPFLQSGVSVQFVKVGDTVPSMVARALSGNATAVAYITKDNQYQLYYHTGKSLNEAVLLHELIHAATMKALRGNLNIPLRNEMRKLLATVKQSFKDAAYRSSSPVEQRETATFMNRVLTDENELLAYAFSSPTMRRWMQNMNAQGKFVPSEKTAAELERQANRRMPGVPPLTTWQKFTDTLRRLFGIAPVNQRAFEKLLADRADAVSGFVEANKDSSLYAKLDIFLDRAMQAQAGQDATTAEPAVAPARDRSGPVERAGVRTAEAIEADIKAQVRGKEVSTKLLSTMMLRQIAEQYGNKLPALHAWIDAIMERGAKASSLAARADRVAVGWEQDVKDPAERKALADIFLRASDAEVELDNHAADYLADLTFKQKAEHTALNKKLAALSPEAQRVRKQVLDILRDQWKYTRASLESFINHTVADPQLRNERIEDLKHEMGRNRGDYFPFGRFGDRIVIAKGAASDGRDVVSFHESEAAANAAVVAHVKAGVLQKNVTATLKTAFDAQQRASGGFVGNMHQMIDNSEADTAAKQELHEALQQLFLRSMPELSGAKAMIRRENIEGYSRDALRVFADSVTRGARYASHLEFGPVMRAAQEAAEQQTRSPDKRLGAVVIGRKDGSKPRVKIVEAGTDRLNAVNSLEADGFVTEFFNAQPETLAETLAGSLPGITPEETAAHVAKLSEVVGRTGEGIQDMRAAKALYNHMIALQAARTKQSNLVDALGQLGHAWFLGFSPSAWATNLLQNPMVGLPHLGAKYGIARATGEWLNTSKWFATLRMGKLFGDRDAQFSVEWMKQEAAAGRMKGVNKQELEMLQVLEDRQVLDFTQAMDLARIGQAASSARYKFLKLAAAGAHHTEVFNRVTFALAAYRLAMKASTNMTHDEAVRQAEKDVVATHYDYSPANAPLAMKGNLAKSIFMFQKYRQHQLYWWATNIKQAIKDESPAEQWRARKACFLMGTTQLVMGGVRALPFVGSIAFLANLLGGADDDGVPFDFNQWISTAAKDVLGDTVGEGFAQGIFGMVGMNVAARIGQGGLLLNAGSEKYERNADDKLRAYLFDLAGPLGSIALGAGRATEAFSRGDVVGGLAATTPKVISDGLKAYQLHEKGIIDKKGLTIAPTEAFDASDVLMQSLGVMPRKVADLKADGARVRNIEQGLKDRTHQLTGGFVEAWARDDRAGMGDAVEAIKQFNATMAARYQDKRFLIDGRQLEAAVKDYQSRAVILAVTSGTAATQRQMLIAGKTGGLNTPVTAESIQQNASGLRGLPGLPGLGR